MQCPPCHRPMKLVDYMDTRETLPLGWMTGWRCEHCGFAINPLDEFNRRFLDFDAQQRRHAVDSEARHSSGPDSFKEPACSGYLKGVMP
jgi:hypothetical protein